MKDSAPSAELKEVIWRRLKSTGSSRGPEAALRANLEAELGTGAPREQSLPPVIPDHALLERIGTGAYGDVWLARNALGTLRAVKIVYRDRFTEARPYEREFHGILKYEPISRSHEGLIAILHVGRNDLAGCFYYIMELADDAPGPATADCGETARAVSGEIRPGQYHSMTLRSVLARAGRLPPTEAAELTLKLAGAMAHLHKHGLVHRDIKPSNVIFVDGKPKLADIGLITGAGDSNSVVGTEGYIPPEGPGSAQADIFSLGKLLYEIGTGRDRLEFPLLPASIVNLTDREALLELNEIITRACSPDRGTRYGSANEMAADLNLFLSGRSLREASTLKRRLRWLRRSAVVGSTLLALATISLLLARNAAQRAKDAEEESRKRAQIDADLRHRAEMAELEARKQLYGALLEQARTKVRTGELGQRVEALQAIRRAAPISNSAALRREALAALALPDFATRRDIPLHGGQTLARMDPSLERFAMCDGSGPVEIRASANDQLLASLPATTKMPAYFADWSPDGRFLAVKRSEPADNRSRIELWDTSMPEAVIFGADVASGAVSFHPLQAEVMGNLDPNSIAIWSLTTGKETRRLPVVSVPELLVISPDGERFAASHHLAKEWRVTVHRYSDGAPLCSQVFLQPVASVAWHPDGRSLAIGNHDSTVSLMDADSGRLQLLGRHKLEAAGVAFSNGGRYLFSGGWEREVICWDLWTRERALTMGMEGFVCQLSTDGKSCAVVSRDCIHLGGFERPTCCREFPEDLGGRLFQAVFSPDGRWLAVAGQEKLGVWDLSREGPGTLSKDGSGSRLAFSSDSRILIASRDDSTRAWKVAGAQSSARAPVLTPVEVDKPEGFTSFCIASNFAILTCSLGSRLLPLDDLSATQPSWLPTITGVNGGSRDGRFLAIFKPYTPWLYIYGLPGLNELAVLTNHVNIYRFDFTADGNQIMISSSGGVTYWQTGTWQRNLSITNCIDAIPGPGGNTCWITKDYRTAGLHDSTTMEPLLPLPAGMLPLGVSPDGNLLAVSVGGRRLQVWKLSEVERQFRELGISWTPQ